jgi:TonB-linked SusC/RagA family outer membrane protein
MLVMCKKLFGCFLKRKQFLILLLPLLFCNLILFAQQKVTVSGAVISERNIPLAGVSIKVKGSTGATITDSAGIFSIKANKNSVLVFSYVGFNENEVKIINESLNLKVQLTSSSETLGDVVVTALGIQRKSIAITYAAQKVAGSELNKVPQTNLMNSLAGKVAGMTISRGSGGLGGSVKVLLRGNKSALGNNQPLYVIDGIPLINITQETQNGTATNRDRGDGISNINPDDIENISVLKGPSAASLYGSQAANGVILVTTKKGKAGVSKIDFNSSITFDNVAFKPQLQNSYGQTGSGSEESWGTPISSARDNISEFYKTGSTFVNSVGFSTGTEKNTTYISYSNNTAKGIIGNNELHRHNFMIRQGSKFLNNRLSVNGSINFVNQTIDDNPNQGFQSNATSSLFLFPRGLDITPFRNNFEKFDSVRNLKTQNWAFTPNSLNENPYWINNRNLYKDKRDRTILNGGIRYDFSDWLNLQLRGNMDKYTDFNTTKLYSGTTSVYGGLNGRFNVANISTTQYYSDAILNFNKSLGNLGVNMIIGTSVSNISQNGTSAGSNDLFIANVFNLQNALQTRGNSNTGIGSISEARQELQAIFGSFNFDWKNWLFLDVTGRNDWSSNLSYTPNGSYFYPSAGVSLVLSDAIKNFPKTISFAKIRGSYSIVGNTVPLNVTNPINSINQGSVIFNSTAPFEDLKPEKINSFEIGTDIRFFNNRLSLDLTYYKANSTNQFFSIAVSPGTGYSRRFINGGDIQNSGIEAILGYTFIPSTNGLQWSSQLNFASNKNKVKELATGFDQFVLATDVNYANILKPGGSYGDIYGQVLDRDVKTGKIFITTDGRPVVKPGPLVYLGNSNPNFQLGWNNDFKFKNFTFSFLVDGSFGGEVMSITQQILDEKGVSKVTGDARTNGGVKIDGIVKGTDAPVASVDAQKWYKTIGGRGKVTGEYMYDATNVRLREFSLGYSFPKRMVSRSGIKDLRLSLIGRNLWYIVRKAPFDPETSLSSGNNWPGVDLFNLPATRSIGVSLKLTF